MSAFPGLGHQASAETIPLDRYRRGRQRGPSHGRDREPDGGTGSSRTGGRRNGAADQGGTQPITMAVVAGVPVMAYAGHLGPESVRECNAVFASAIRLRPRWIVTDLSRATIDDDSVPVLGWLRRFAGRHGVKFVLAAVPPRAVEVLRRAEAAPLYEFHTTVDLALAAAAQEAHRSFHRN